MPEEINQAVRIAKTMMNQATTKRSLPQKSVDHVRTVDMQKFEPFIRTGKN